MNPQEKRHWMMACGMTLVRLASVPLFLVYLNSSTRETGTQAGILIVICTMLLDIVDGRYASLMGVDVPSRRLLDIVVDKIISHALMLSVVVAYGLPIWIYATLVCRDLIAGYGAARLVQRHRLLYYPTAFHKTAFACLGLAFCLLIAGSSWVWYLPVIGAYAVYYLSAVDLLGSRLILRTMQLPRRRSLGEYRPESFDGLRAIVRHIVQLMVPGVNQV